MTNKILLGSWVVCAIALLLYSFTQVDLSLTLSQVSIWQGIQKFFQQIGYFNRPLSTVLFLGITGFMFALYGITLNLIRKNTVDRKLLWKIIIATSVILFFSYNAFSYDLFNYIFDAKIFTHYGQNPYEYKALDFPSDPMLSFMHWTHRTYPYGIGWLFLTVPLSFLGFGYFLLTFYLFKLLMLSSFIGSCFLIEKIAKKTNSNVLFPVAAFALNPLVLIESLVSAHNDSVMMALGLFGIYMFLEKRYIASLAGVIGSIFIKYATVLIIPAIIAKGFFPAKGSAASGRKNEFFFYILIISMAISILLAAYRTNFQPWYLLYVLSFAAFVSNRYFVLIPVFLISFAAILQYVPYLYLGNWNPPVPIVLNWIMIASIIASVVLIAVWKLKQRLV